MPCSGILERTGKDACNIQNPNLAHVLPMLRKPILMPPRMIANLDEIASDRKVSSAEVVRKAVEAFDGDLTPEEGALLNALAETMIRTTREVM